MTFSQGGNWLTGNAPQAGDVAEFNANANVVLDGAVEVAGFKITKNVTLNLAGHFVDVAGNIEIAGGANDNASFALTNTGAATGFDARKLVLGTGAAATGSLTVSDKVTLATSKGVTIGSATGKGTFTVGQGGTAIMATIGVADRNVVNWGSLNFTNGSKGELQHLAIQGPDAAHPGAVTISGVNTTVNVENPVFPFASITVGNNNGAASSLTVDAATVIVQRSLTIGGSPDVPTATLSNGAKFTCSGVFFTTNAPAGVASSLTVTGSGTALTTQRLENELSDATITVGDSAKLTIAEELKLRSSGGSTLTIAGGSEVSAGTAEFAVSLNTVSATVNITGSDSRLLVGTGGLVLGGGLGTGTMTIGAGATCSVNGSVALAAFDPLWGYTSAHATLTLNGGMMTLEDPLLIGQGGEATVNVLAGGQLGSSTSTIYKTAAGASQVNVSGADAGGSGSYWGNELLTVYGALNVSAGGFVTSELASVGTGTTDGTATVTGSGSKWDVGGALDVGGVGGGTLDISDGALVTSGSGSIGAGTYTDDGNHSRATIASATWKTTSGGFVIGNGTHLATLTFTGGTLDVAGEFQKKVKAKVVNSGKIISGGNAVMLGNDGDLIPADSYGNLGTIEFDTNFFDATAGVTIQIKLGSAGECSSIHVLNGDAALGGEVILEALGSTGYTDGTSFTIFSADGGISGTFENLTAGQHYNNATLPPLATGLAWLVEYNESDVTLKVVTAHTPALPSNFVQAAYAQGRIGVIGSGDFEMDVGKNTSQPQDRAYFSSSDDWDSGETKHFVLSVSGGVMTFTLGGYSRSFGITDPYTDLFIRAAGTATSEMEISNLTFNGAAVDDMVESSGTARDVMHLNGVDLSTDFTLEGDATMTWSGTRPMRSSLAFQIYLGTLV